MVLKQQHVGRQESVAFLPKDSLGYVATTERAVEQQFLCEDASDWVHRSYLATYKHAAKLSIVESCNWPQLLIQDGDYIEAIMQFEIELASIASVRLPSEDPLWDTLADGYGTLEAERAADLSEFAIVLEDLARSEIRWSLHDSDHCHVARQRLGVCEGRLSDG